MLAPELAPGMYRPGPEELWAHFDQTVADLAQALSGSSPAALAAAFSELAEVSGVLAVEAGRLYRSGAVGRAGRAG